MFGVTRRGTANQPKAARDFVTRAGQNGCELVNPTTDSAPSCCRSSSCIAAPTRPCSVSSFCAICLVCRDERATRRMPPPLQRVLRALLTRRTWRWPMTTTSAGGPSRWGPALRAAQKSAPRSDDEETILQHNLAVVDINEGRSVGEKTLERLGTEPAGSAGQPGYPAGSTRPAAQGAGSVSSCL